MRFAPLRALALLPLLLAGCSLTPSASPTATPHAFGRLIALRNSIVPYLDAARDVQRLSPNQHLQITVNLRLRDQAGMRTFLQAAYNPHSAHYHRFLTSRQFRARFAPGASFRERVSQWLRDHGLQVTEESGNGLTIVAQGTGAQVAAAFATRIDRFVQGNRHFFANVTPIHIPAQLAPGVLSVSGLNDAFPLQPRGVPLLPARRATRSAPEGYGPSDLRAAYDLTPLYGDGADGSGQTIALVEFADYQPSNVSAYDQQFGLNGPVPERIPVPVGGKTAQLGSKAGQDEVELDIEVLQAIAPRAQILVYVAPNTASADVDVYSRIVSDRRAQVISDSWGRDEGHQSSGKVQALHQLFQEAAAQGQSIFVAAGDAGAYDDTGDRTKLAVDFPGSDPWVTDVGGTSLFTTAASYGHEEVWGNHARHAGGGGGVSALFQRPDYQSGVSQTVANGMRQVPDVSADSDPATGYAVFTIDSNNQPGWTEYGGTSAATPLWAAYTALLNEYLRQPLGFINPTLYSLGARANTFQFVPFHDVTIGDNLYYRARPGWDFATGWGSLDGTALLNAMTSTGSAPPPPATTPTPAPTDVPTTSPVSRAISYQVRAQWEGVSGNGSYLSTLKRGRSVQVVVYLLVNSAPPSAPVQLTYTVFRGSQVAFQASTSGKLDATKPEGTYRVPKVYSPSKAGTYTFMARATIGGQTLQRAKSLLVTG